MPCAPLHRAICDVAAGIPKCCDREIERPRGESVFHKLFLETALHLCSLPLVTQTDSGGVWEENTQGCEHQEAGSTVVLSEAGYRMRINLKCPLRPRAG